MLEDKPIYSKQVTAIMQDAFISEKLKNNHTLRILRGLPPAKSDIYLMSLALDIQRRHYEREIKNRKRREEEQKLRVARDKKQLEKLRGVYG